MRWRLRDLTTPETPLRTSLVVTCRDRATFLRDALATWRACPDLDEIVIVDYGSDPPLAQMSWIPSDPRVLLATVPAKAWHMARAVNVGLRLARGAHVFKVDADVCVQPEFFARHPLDGRHFWAGNWREARDDNERHLNGSVFLTREAIEAVGGYNEHLRGYGSDDTDFYERLGAAGWTRRDVDADCLRHLPHDDALRAERDPLASILVNRALAGLCPWGPSRPVPQYRVHAVGPGHVHCELVEDPVRVPRSVQRAAERTGLTEYLALKQGRSADDIPRVSLRALRRWTETAPTDPTPPRGKQRR